MPHTPSLTIAPSLVTPPPPNGNVRRRETGARDALTLMRQAQRTELPVSGDLLAEFRRRIRRRRGFLSTILTSPLGATESPEGIRRTLLGGGGT